MEADSSAESSTFNLSMAICTTVSNHYHRINGITLLRVE